MDVSDEIDLYRSPLFAASLVLFGLGAALLFGVFVLECVNNKSAIRDFFVTIWSKTRSIFDGLTALGSRCCEWKTAPAEDPAYIGTEEDDIWRARRQQGAQLDPFRLSTVTPIGSQLGPQLGLQLGPGLGRQPDLVESISERPGIFVTESQQGPVPVWVPADPGSPRPHSPKLVRQNAMVPMTARFCARSEIVSMFESHPARNRPLPRPVTMPTDLGEAGAARSLGPQVGSFSGPNEPKRPSRVNEGPSGPSGPGPSSGPSLGPGAGPSNLYETITEECCIETINVSERVRQFGGSHAQKSGPKLKPTRSLSSDGVRPGRSTGDRSPSYIEILPPYVTVQRIEYKRDSCVSVTSRTDC